LVRASLLARFALGPEDFAITMEGLAVLGSDADFVLT
jgi:hypothetical protein